MIQLNHNWKTLKNTIKTSKTPTRNFFKKGLVYEIYDYRYVNWQDIYFIYPNKIYNGQETLLKIISLKKKNKNKNTSETLEMI